MENANKSDKRKKRGVSVKQIAQSIIELNKEESINFIEEMKRIESLPKDSPEAIARHRFFEGCKEKSKNIKLGE